jgi:hypothetical protein
MLTSLVSVLPEKSEEKYGNDRQKLPCGKVLPVGGKGENSWLSVPILKRSFFVTKIKVTLTK